MINFFKSHNFLNKKIIFHSIKVWEEQLSLCYKNNNKVNFEYLLFVRKASSKSPLIPTRVTTYCHCH